MKKLMIAAFAAMVGISVNAAAISWAVDEAYQPGGDVLTGDYYGYFIASSGTGASATYALQSALEDLARGDASFVDTYALANSQSQKGFAFDNGVGNANSIGSFNNDQTVTGYLVILDASSAANATKAYVASVTEMGDTPSAVINNIGGSDTIQFGYLDATATAGNWYTVGTSPTPEPTSGLLLLLGVAGLALRRRRA